MEGMIDIGGILYTLDLDAFNDVLTKINGKQEKSEDVETSTTYDSDGNVMGVMVVNKEFDKPIEIDGPKYDVLRMCLEILLTYNEEVDDSLGLERALKSTTIPFKIAFNTLLDYGILKEIE
jgi:hypothetical protein